MGSIPIRVFFISFSLTSLSYFTSFLSTFISYTFSQFTPCTQSRCHHRLKEDLSKLSSITSSMIVVMLRLLFISPSISTLSNIAPSLVLYHQAACCCCYYALNFSCVLSLSHLSKPVAMAQMVSGSTHLTAHHGNILFIICGVMLGDGDQEICA